LHDALHLEPNLTAFTRPLGLTDAVKAGKRAIFTVGVERRAMLAKLHRLRGLLRRGASKYNGSISEFEPSRFAP